jgi:mRNA interferase YafQ
MLAAIRSRQFRRDVKRAEKRGKDLSKLRSLITLLMAATPLPAQYMDHPLRGNRKGYRDAHLESDWVLIYRVVGDELHLVRTGTHADLFNE